MTQDLMIEEIADSTLKIVRIFLQAIENFRSEDLFTKSELMYMHDVFAVWLGDNDNCLGKVNGLMDAKGNIKKGWEKALIDLYEATKATRLQAENFDRSFKQLCLNRAKTTGNMKEIKELFEITQNETV